MKDRRPFITAVITLLSLSPIALSSCSDSDTCVCPNQDEPNYIDDLAAGLPGFNSIVLTWTAPEGAVE